MHICLPTCPLFLFETVSPAKQRIGASPACWYQMNPVSALVTAQCVGNNHGMFITFITQKKSRGQKYCGWRFMELYGMIWNCWFWHVLRCWKPTQLVFSCFKLLCQCTHISAYWHHTWPVRQLIHWFKKHVAQVGVWKWGIPGHT